ncbi:MAG: response regulator [Bryobacteraceae bacterium]|nr:response regulator [Bryobacteraceae bacterium]
MVQIAVVDDDPSVRTGLSRLLCAFGFEVNSFASAEEFLVYLASNGPDCLILDRQLGGMSGDELMAELTTRGTELPTVVISATEERAYDQRHLSDGRIVVRLRKPFGAAALLDAVQLVIRQHQQAT